MFVTGVFLGVNMCLFFDIFGLQIPSYGSMIALGVVLANVVAYFMVKRYHHDWLDFIIIEAYVCLGAFLGAKLLYLLVSYEEIDWSRMTEPVYFNAVMRGGFVFYGGLIGGLLAAVLAGCLHKLPVVKYIRTYIFLIPFIHAFGRTGCFLAGCCWGVPYEGFGAVRFPENSFAPSDVTLFPVQLVEAVFLLVIALIIIGLQLRKNWRYTLELYLVLYGVCRFILENFRYDEARGRFWLFSTSQWISILMFVVAAGLFLWDRLCGKKEVTAE